MEEDYYEETYDEFGEPYYMQIEEDYEDDMLYEDDFYIEEFFYD